MSVYGSFIHNHPKQKTTQMYINCEWINCGIDIQRNTIQQCKGMNSSYTHAWISETLD